MSSYTVGVDVGGTFTDCVVLDPDGNVTTAKSPSVPTDFTQGMINAIRAAAAELGEDPARFFEKISTLAHGTTIGTNAVLQKRGAKVGLITTKGHHDVLHIMRGSRGIPTHDVQRIVHFSEGPKPEPIVPRRLIHGVSERIDCLGNVVVPLNEEEARSAILQLLDRGAEAIAISFLWSFLFPDHERRVRDLVREIAPKTFVTCSADLVPKWGEYERTTATVINAYIGPLTSTYLQELDKRLKEYGYRRFLQITQCGGGTILVEAAMEAPILTLDSGPVAGVTGSLYLGRLMNYPNIITTDMGGTSFDVGLVVDGKPEYSSVSNVNQYEFFIPKVDIRAIGSGGGSLVKIDEATRSIRVGPESAGADPGPICYDHGGEIPTVTDADVVLGYIDPDNFAGGQMKLNKTKAEAAIGDLATRLSMSLLECASGITKIAEFQMADIIRKTTVGKGHDPRDFVLFAFGGAGPAHTGVFARELGVQKVIIPQRKAASTWCAFGAASADILHVYEKVDIMISPFDSKRVNENIDAILEQARQQMASENIPQARRRFEISIDMRHHGQINEVEVEINWTSARAGFEEALRRAFYARYEQLYGKGSSFAAARVEIVTFRVRAMADTPRPRLRVAQELTDAVPQAAHRPARIVYWDECKAVQRTRVYDGMQLLAGNRIEGPAIVQTPDTSVVVRPDQALLVDRLNNFELLINNPGESAQL